jgi:hypothetical protein
MHCSWSSNIMKVKKLVQSICASILHKVRQIQSIRDLWLCTYDNTVQADMIQNSNVSGTLLPSDYGYCELVLVVLYMVRTVGRPITDEC